MKACTEFTSQITEVVSGAADKGDRPLLLEHLRTCKACSEAFDRLQSIVAVTSNKSDPGEAYWDNYYAQLSSRMDEVGAQVPFSSRLVALTPRWALQVAAAVILLVSGVLIGRITLTGDSSSQQLAVAESTRPTPVQERAYSYLDRSKTLLLGVVNFDTSEDDPSTLNLDRRRSMAGSLIQEASLLQADLSAADERRLSDLIADLEIILLQIANIESTYDLPEIEMVQSGVHRKAIMFKINIESMRRFNKQNPSSFDVSRRSASSARNSAV